MSAINATKEQEKKLVRDKIRLLFSDPRTNKEIAFFTKFKIIIRPNLIWELLVLFENFDAEIKLEILNELSDSLAKFPLNSLSLVTKTNRKLPNNKNQNIIDTFIDLTLKSVETNPKMVDDLMNVVSMLCCHNKLQKSQLNVVYSNLSEKFYNNNLNSATIFHSLCLLRKILINQNPKFDEPQSFFYFTGFNSGLKAGAKSPVPWSFSTGFALGVWFYIEEANEVINDAKEVFEATGKTCPKLFTIHCQGSGGLEAYFLGKNLYYRILPINYTEPAHGSNGVLVGVFQPKTWYYVGLEHERQMVGRSHLNIVIDNEYKKTINIEFPKFASNAAITITKFTIGENLIGRISSLILFKTPINQTKLIELRSLFSLGIQTNNTIRNFNISMEKLLGNILLLYTPIRAVEDACYDIFGAHHGVLFGNSGFINKDYTQFRFGALGGVTSILPFFYFLRFIDNQEYPLILDELLKILILLFRNKPENQFEASKLGFFKIMGQLLSEVDKGLFSTESIELLAELKNSLNNPKLTEEMFVGLLWKTEIYDNVSEEIREQALKYIRTIYLQNPTYNFTLFNVKNIIDLVIDKYDAPFKKVAVLNSSQEWNSTKTADFKKAEKVLKPVLSIIEVALFNGGEIAFEALTNIVNALTFKCSPYLHILMLQMLKRFIGKRDDPSQNAKTYLRILSEARAAKNFLYLMTNTSCLDLKAMCIKFLNILTTYVANGDNETEIAQYLSGILYSASSTQKDKDPYSDKTTEADSNIIQNLGLEGNIILPNRQTPSKRTYSESWLPHEVSRMTSAPLLTEQIQSQKQDENNETQNERETNQAASQNLQSEKNASEAENQNEGQITKEMLQENKLNEKIQSLEDKTSIQGNLKLKIFIKDQGAQNDANASETKPNTQSSSLVEEQKESRTPQDSLKPDSEKNKEGPAFKGKSLRKKPVLKPIPIPVDKSPVSVGESNTFSKLVEENQAEKVSEFTDDMSRGLNSEESSMKDSMNNSTIFSQARLEQTQGMIEEPSYSIQIKSPEGISEGEISKTSIHREIKYNIMYNSLLEWLLHKEPMPLEESVMIDDTDKIKSANAIHVIIKFFRFANDSIKQKVIQDIYMLVKWNTANCSALLGIHEFQYFLLDVLDNCQIELFNSELRGVPAAIWELGVRTYTILAKFALFTEAEGHQRLLNLFTWVASKKISFANKPERNKQEKASHYLIRHLWLHLLESIEVNSSSIYPSSRSNLWTNIIQIAFYTEEIITSALNSYLPHLAQMKSETEIFSPLRNFITELTTEEEAPNNFKPFVKRNLWVDSKICGILIKAVKPLWEKAAWLNIKGDEKLNQIKKIEKKLTATMDVLQIEEQSKLLELFFQESKEKDFPNRGPFLKIIIQMLVCYTEDSVRKKILEEATLGCEQIESLLTFLLILGENIRDKNLSPQRKNFLVASIVYLLKFLYQILGITEEEKELHKKIISSIKNVMIHLMCIVDFVNLRSDNSITMSISTGSNPTKETTKTNFSMISSEILNYLSVQDQPIITIQIIRTSKSKEFASLEERILSPEWRKAFTESTKSNPLINDHYKTSLTVIMAEMARKIEDRSYSQALRNNKNEKKNEEAQKKYGIEIVETALEIYEQEDYKRQEFIANEEEFIRTTKNQWKKLWKRMRIYVGQWKHPLFYDQEDFKFNADKESFDAIRKNNIFTHKISKFEIKSRARPFLKIKLVEPAYVEQYNIVLSKKRDHVRNLINALSSTVFFNQNILSELPNPNKRFSFVSLGRGIKKTFKSMIPISNSQMSPFKLDPLNRLVSPSATMRPSFESPLKQETFLTKKCQWIKTLTIRNGFLQLSSQKLSFIVEGLDQKENHIAFLKHSLPDDRKLSKEWPLESLKEIQRRRYIFRKSALEIMLTDGSTLLFNLTEPDLEEVVSTIVRIKKIRCPNLIYHGTLDPRKIIDKANLTRKWLNYEMSNFAYLMHLNSLSGRSYKDLTQYPVFPWIIKNYIKETLDLLDPSVYRELYKTLGALGSPERVNTFIERFENTDTFDPVPPFHFGSHYSSPAIVLQYLVRLAPYTQGAIQLQSGRFDLADRLFYSMQESYRGATEEIADVRELIPEFFFLPDFLLNREKLDFGVTQYGLRVHHVTTPKWSQNNPYLFVAILREALESEIVSRSLHQWIDLIFGYKQTGPEAEKNLNVFFYMTYEDKVDLNMLEEPSTKISYESQIVHFGQTPSQLFVKPHPQRPSIDSIQSTKIFAKSLDQATVYRPQPKPHSSSSLSNISALLKMTVINDYKILGYKKDGRAVYYKWSSGGNTNDLTNSGPFKCSIEREKFVKLEKGKDEFIAHSDPSVTYISNPVVFLNAGKVMAFGGYWDGRLSLYSLETETLAEVYYPHNDTITAISTDDKEKFLITGAKSGECILWRFSPEINKLNLKFQFYDHEDMVLYYFNSKLTFLKKINHIFISTDMRLFATAANDGKINIYHLITGQLMRTIYHPSNLPIEMVALSSCPLPSVIFFSSEDKSLYSYSINGRLLEIVTEEFNHALAPIIIKDPNFLEMLVFANEKGELFVRDLPFLNLKRKWDISPGVPILNILLLKDRKYLLCGCGDGEFSVITDPNFILQDNKKNEEELTKSPYDNK